MRKGRGTLVRIAFWWGALLAAMFSWWQLLWPPIGFYRRTESHPSGADVLGELLKPRNAIYDEPFVGWVFLGLSAVLVLVLIHWTRSIADYLQNSRVGISVLESSFELEIEDAARASAKMKRTQAFHANRRGITAYRSNSQCDMPNGKILRHSVKQVSTAANKPLTKELLIRGSESNMEVIEIFDRELPTSLLATFLPNWLVCALHRLGMLDSVVVKRVGEWTYSNEFSGRDGVYSVTATKYPISRTSIRVGFVDGAEPPEGAIRGFLIRENVVEEVHLHREVVGTHVFFQANARALHMESLRVQWRFP